MVIYIRSLTQWIRVPVFETGGWEFESLRTGHINIFMHNTQNGIKFYKIKLLKKLLGQTAQIRQELFNELVNNATDPVIVERRLRMLRQLNLYENQLTTKIQNFDTNDIADIDKFDPWIKLKSIIHPSS